MVAVSQALKVMRMIILGNFSKLFDIFKELITHTSGDVDEALDWLRELDKEYKLTTPEYTIEDFVEDLKKKGYLKEEIDPSVFLLI